MLSPNAIKLQTQSHRSAQQKHKTQTVFYTSRISLMSPVYRKNRKSSNNQRNFSLTHKKIQTDNAESCDKGQGPVFGLEINMLSQQDQRKEMKNDDKEFMKNKNNGKMNGKSGQDNKLLRQSLALLSGTDELKRQINKIGKKNNPVHKMLSDYKMIVEQGQKEKRKRNSRLHANMKTYTQNNCEQSKTNDDDAYRRKIVKLMNYGDVCHLGSIKHESTMSKNHHIFYKINDLKYEGKQAPIDHTTTTQNRWKVSNTTQNTHFRMKKKHRHHSEDKSFASLINRDQSLIQRLGNIKKEIEMIRSGKIQGNTLAISRNYIHLAIGKQRFPRDQKIEQSPQYLQINNNPQKDRQNPSKKCEQEQEEGVKTNAIKYKQKSQQDKRGPKKKQEYDIVVDGWKLDNIDEEFDENGFGKHSLFH